MDDLESLLHGIVAHPDDDPLRLVLADWLEENGEQQHAEFIRLQVALANMDPLDDGFAEKTARMHRCGMFTRSGNTPFLDYLPTRKCRIGFQRGLIETIDTADAGRIDISGLDLVPLHTLRTYGNLIKKFTGCDSLKRIEYPAHNVSAKQLLALFGPAGKFKKLQELCLPHVEQACLEAGVIPKFDLPELRNFFISTAAFYELGTPTQNESESHDDEYYLRDLPWSGLPGYLPANAIPATCPLERFIWHSEDDCDYFGNEEDWYWRGPDMQTLLECLKGHSLKQFEVVAEFDDHGGSDSGVIAAPYAQNPLDICDPLECVTFEEESLPLLHGSTQKLKQLRIYEFESPQHLHTLLQQPVCSALEHLRINSRSGCWGKESPGDLNMTFAALRSLYLSWTTFAEWTPLSLFARSKFPVLTSLTGYITVDDAQSRHWPRLQHLELCIEKPADLKKFAKSDCCPNLTTLTITFKEYGDREKINLSMLADCPHMPWLSLIHVPDFDEHSYWIVDEAKLSPVRSDVVFEGEKKPWLGYYIPVAF